MKIQLVSDVHTEFHLDGGLSWANSLPVEGDVLVIAGDLGNSTGIDPVLRTLSRRFNDVVYVAGNHEYYGSNRTTCESTIAATSNDFSNVHFLNKSDVTIGGQRFVGTTMWFMSRPDDILFNDRYADFSHIQGFSELLSAKNMEEVDYLFCNINKDDVVVTHFLPSYECVSEKYRSSPINRFFVNNQEDLIYRVKPKYWLFGHTHDSVDLKVGQTSFLCNPFGYPSEAKPERVVTFDV